jgi:hypothetical protein
MFHDEAVKLGLPDEQLGITMTGVSHWLQMRPSTHLLNLMRDCVRRGWLIEQRSVWHKSGFRSLFFLSADGAEFALLAARFGGGWR